jgi:tRNA(adenine34) deaminase
MSKEEDIKLLRQAIEKSKESFEQGNFPAGALVVRDGEIISSAVGSPYPGLFHADSKAVSAAFEKMGPLTGASLYVGLENCLMCLGVAYWAGIRDIYFAIPKSKVSGDYYETHAILSNLPKEFNEPIRLHHIPELEEEALQIIKDWESSLQ